MPKQVDLFGLPPPERMVDVKPSCACSCPTIVITKDSLDSITRRCTSCDGEWTTKKMQRPSPLENWDGKRGSDVE